MKKREPQQLSFHRTLDQAWMDAPEWDYARGMPDRRGLAQYVHLIRAPHPFEPPETMKRGGESRSLGGENDRKKKAGTPAQWAARIVALLEDKRPRTFNTICVQLTGTTADCVGDNVDAGLWLACERLDIAWTVHAPVFWTLTRFVDWKDGAA